MGKMMNSLAFVDRLVLNALKVVTIVSFVFLTILISANVFVRFFPVVAIAEVKEALPPPMRGGHR